MTTQYWIGGFFVDLSRNQISQNNHIQTLAPKALAVLTFLAEHHGEVVSQDALLTKVWGDVSVSANTLQKSIAQLRKALGDNGNLFIKTHAKQGYSLECDVRWQKDYSSHTPTATAQETPLPLIQKKRAIKPSKWLATISTVVVLFLVLFLFKSNVQEATHSPAFSFGELRALTATDNKELASIYSPNGEFIVFHRYSADDCINHIWAKNIETSEEFQLTENFDAYGSHQFSRDGKQLVFIRKINCSEPIVQKKCYQLMSLDFIKALESPQSMRILLECKNTEIKSPYWLNNNEIALLQKESGRWKLIRFSPGDNQSETIYAINDGNIIDYDYSIENDLIAVTSIHSDGHYYIETLKPDGTLLSSHRINYPEEIAQYRLIYPNFSPLKDQLVFSTGRQLFSMSYAGQIKNISLPIDKSMSTPSFHPQGKRALVIKGYYDSDIASLSLDDIQHQPSPSNEHKAETLSNYSVIVRSTVSDDNGQLQPNGSLIAFRSDRSGVEQIWLKDGANLRQLSNFPIDTFLYEIIWAKDGLSLLVNVDHELWQLFLDGRANKIYHQFPIDSLFHWDSENQIALVNARVSGITRFSEVDLMHSKLQTLNEKEVKWANKDGDNEIIYSDQLDRFWRPGPAEDQLISDLNQQGSDKRFLIKGKVIYGVNENLQLWRYALDQNTFAIIGELPGNLDYLTDIDGSQLLMTLRIASNKEVAELFLKE